jgi:hypothetical protein
VTRRDLLALDTDGLTVLANRGLVRRAGRDVADRDDLHLTVAADGAVTVAADDATTTLPAGARPEDATCTCVAGGVCRHVVRAILLYQASQPLPGDGVAADGPASSGGQDARTTEPGGATPRAPAPGAADDPWDPGTLTDDALLDALGARIVARAGSMLRTASAVALVRARTPVARLLDAGVAVRFLVPGDASWARCTCAAEGPCPHVAVAVQAFRALAADRTGGTVEIGTRPEVDAAARAACEEAVLLLCESGVAAAGPAVRDVLDRASARAGEAGWGWIAEVVAELAETCRRHEAADPSFVPLQVAELVGEALARLDALDAEVVPRGLVAGRASSGDVGVRGGVLVGLGTVARRVGRTTAVDALLLDGGGTVAGAGRTVVDPTDREPPTFAHVGSGALQAGVSCADAGRGQLVTIGARVRPDGRLVLGRRRVALSAQRYDWEHRLPPGVLAAGFAEATALGGPDLPRALTARAIGTGFAVVPVAEADGGWDRVEHAVVVRLRDHAGDEATLVHPYSAQGADGVEALLHGIGSGGRVRAVAGWVRPHAGGPRVRATGVVVEDAAGHRSLLQPWTDAAPARDRDDGPPARSAASDATGLVAAFGHALGDLLTAGVGRPDGSVRRRWRGLLDDADAAGSVVLVVPVRRIVGELERSALDAGWRPEAAVRAAADLAVLLAAAADLGADPHP